MTAISQSTQNLQGDHVVTNSGFKETYPTFPGWGNHMFSIIYQSIELFIQVNTLKAFSDKNAILVFAF